MQPTYERRLRRCQLRRGVGSSTGKKSHVQIAAQRRKMRVPGSGGDA